MVMDGDCGAGVCNSFDMHPCCSTDIGGDTQNLGINEMTPDIIAALFVGGSLATLCACVIIFVIRMDKKQRGE